MPDFQSMFMASKGQPVEYGDRLIHMVDRLSIAQTQRVVVTFERAGSDWRQGVHLSTKGTFEINGQTISNAIVLWHDTAPETVDLVVKSKTGECLVKNVWDIGDGVMHSWHNGGAMAISDHENGRLYECNDGRPDDDFDDLVFRLNLID